MSMKKISTAFSQSHHGHTSSGFTLIELLIAMVIGLLGTIVIFTVYQNAEGFKRTTIAAGDAQTSGAIALYTLEQYIRNSGSSIATTNESKVKDTISTVQANMLLGCTLSPEPGSGAGAAVTQVGGVSTPIAPVRIIDGSQLPGGIAGTSDVLIIMGGNADIATNPTVAGPVGIGDLSITSSANLLGWRAASPGRLADIALFTQGGGVSLISGTSCTLRRILSTSSPSGSGAINLVKPIALAYGPITNIHDVGPSPYFVSIGVNANQELVETNFLPGLIDEGTGANRIIQRVIAEGVVNIQAQYGIDDNLDDVIDFWVEPTNLNGANGNWTNVVGIVKPGTPQLGVPAINKIKAIRIAILARSQQYEAPNRTTGLCNATPANPVWRRPLAARAAVGTGPTGSRAYPQSADILPTFALTGASPNGDFLCFRYRSFETIVPIINMVKSPL
jgi:type IV pilus assembly protein PilW